MIENSVDIAFFVYLAAWLALPAVLFMVHTRNHAPGGFLVYTYIFGFIMSHWFGALAHASPWNNFSDSTNTVVGFRYSTIGMFALAAGALLIDVVRPLDLRQHSHHVPKRMRATQIRSLQSLDQLAAKTYMPIGIIAWLASFTALSSLPSAGAILSVGKQCLLLGMCLLCWSAWHQGNRSRVTLLLGLSALLPVATVLSSGFIGYGIVMVVTILAFIAMFYRPRWHLLACLALLLYGGVSLWVTYAAHRNEIRASVWGGENTSNRIDKLTKMISEFGPFDITDQTHLYYVDLRLNQNELVGAAIATTPAMVPFRDGETIYAAMAAVIPRFLWPDKPAVGGSGDYVSQHTLITFAANTSVGMGQVLEFYINFGLTGVIVGFALLGMALRYLDMRLAESLVASDWNTVMLVFLVGSGLLQAGGSLMEVAASAATGWVLSTALAYILQWTNRSTQASQ
ncbi:MAG: hypothetical protein ABL931_11550 [Usitatibacteraceae bacterium]